MHILLIALARHTTKKKNMIKLRHIILKLFKLEKLF